MVLRCPRCSVLEYYGRTQVLGDLVVCPRCEVVFRWKEVGDRTTSDVAASARSESARPKAKP